MNVREMLPGELDSVGSLRVGAYAAQDLFASTGAYASVLRSLGAEGAEGAEGDAAVLVAVEDGELLGTVMLQPWGPDSEIARDVEEIEMRALAVSPAAQGRGVGRALVDAR